jgi:hypothetical protein
MGKGTGMNRVIRAMVLGMCGLVSSGAYAFIYEVKVLKKWDSARKRYHYFMGLSDFHDKQHEATPAQIEAIQDLLKQMPRQETKVIVEDLSTENHCGRKSCGRFFLNSRGGILGGLAQTCKANRLEVDNVEYRYCRVIALGPLLHNLKADLSSIPSLKGVRVSDIMQEVQSTADHIKRYNDGSTLAKWYAQHLRDLAVHIERLKMDQYKNMSMAEYVSKHTTQVNRLKILKYLLTFDSDLLNVLMVHYVQAAADKERVVAVAGGTHIMHVVEMLKKLGYKEVYSSKPEYFHEHNLEKCLGSNVTDGGFCVRPHPVKGEVFKKIANPTAL